MSDCIRTVQLDMIIVNIGVQVLRKVRNTVQLMWSFLDGLYIYVQVSAESDPRTISVLHIQVRWNQVNRCENIDDFLKLVAKMSSFSVNGTDEIQSFVFLNTFNHASVVRWHKAFRGSLRDPSLNPLVILITEAFTFSLRGKVYPSPPFFRMRVMIKLKHTLKW